LKFPFRTFFWNPFFWQFYQLFINVSLPTLRKERKLLTEMKFVITYVLIFLKKESICCREYANIISTHGN
jgi:hypothetical protein